MVIILSAPSGGGKSTIARRLIAADPKLKLSISVTTRLPRLHEKEGVHYFFTNPDLFQTMVKEDKLLEYATIYNNQYGTMRSCIDQHSAAGFDILFDIDYQGMVQIKKQLTDCRIISIFLLPPTLEVLRQRIMARDPDIKEEDMELRMKLAAEEIKYASKYDYSIINDNLDHTVITIQDILAKQQNTRK